MLDLLDEALLFVPTMHALIGARAAIPGRTLSTPGFGPSLIGTDAGTDRVDIGQRPVGLAVAL